MQPSTTWHRRRLRSIYGVQVEGGSSPAFSVSPVAAVAMEGSSWTPALLHRLEEIFAEFGISCAGVPIFALESRHSVPSSDVR